MVDKGVGAFLAANPTSPPPERLDAHARRPADCPGAILLTYRTLRLDAFAHDPELHGLLDEVHVEAVDALDSAAHATRVLQRSLNQQTPAGTPAADLASYAASRANQVRVDILRGFEEFLRSGQTSSPGWGEPSSPARDQNCPGLPCGGCEPAGAGRSGRDLCCPGRPRSAGPHPALTTGLHPRCSPAASSDPGDQTRRVRRSEGQRSRCPTGRSGLRGTAAPTVDRLRRPRRGAGHAAPRPGG